MGSGVQNIRFLRLVILFVAVVLTIFMYASYYSSRSFALPHIRTVKNNNITNSIALESKNNSEKTNVFPKNGPNGSKNTNTQYDAARVPAKRHREPTIDVEAHADADVEVEPALDEHALMKDQQYQQIVENNIDNTYNTSAVQLQPVERIENNANKVVDSDVLIPTSNLQKFIENADKILKNLTNSPQLVEKSHENEVKPSNEIKNAPLDAAVLSKVPAFTGVKSKNKSNNNINTTTTTTKRTASVPIKHVPPSFPSSVDLTQGIPTNRIYESGHLDDEINIEQICPDEGTEIKLLIIITSAQSHQESRLAIRQTWGHFGGRRDVATVFILGRSYNDTLNTALTQENFIYGDLVRGQFIDTYNNLTLKTISALEWVDKHCSRAKFVLKTDDDMFINVPKLLSFLDKHGKEKRIIYGRLAKKWKPIRNSKSKYYVSPKQFSATIFPPFTTGPAYVLSADTIHDLYQQALQQTYLKLEDVFTTGIIAQQLGIRRVHVNEFLNRRIAFNPCNIRKTISVHMIKSNEQFDLWKKLLDKTTKCK